MSAKIIAAILLIATVQSMQPISNTKDFAIGFFTGLRATDKVAHGLPCVSDMEAIAPKIQEGIADLYTLKPFQMVKGIAEIYEAYKPIIAEGSDCSAVNEEAADWFAEIRSAFTDSKKREQGLSNLFRSLPVVKQDLSDVETSIGQNDFLAGDKLGDIIAIYVWGTTETVQREEIKVQPIKSQKDFAIGLFTGMKATDDVSNGLPCVQTLEEKVPEIKEAIAQIKTQNPIKMLKAVQQLLSAYKALWSAGSDCQLTVTEGKVWFATIETAFTDNQKREQGLMNLFKNFNQVTSDFDAFEQFEGTNDFLAGAKLGDIIALYVYGPATTTQTTTSQVSVKDLLELMNLSGVPHDFTDCSNGASLVKVSSISFAQNPVKGQKDAMSIVGQAADHVELKQIVMNVKLSGVAIHTESQPVTDVLDNGDAFNFDYSVFIPTISPSGDYDITFNLKDMTDKSVSCINVKLSL